MQKMAHNIVHYSTKVKPGDRVLIEMIGSERELLKCIINEVHQAGGYPFVQLTDRSVQRIMIQSMKEENFEMWRELDLIRMKSMDVYIAIRSGDNASELSGIPNEQLRRYEKIYYKPVHLDQRVRHARWVVMRYPSPSMAQLANMNTDDFEDFYFNVCGLDYELMSLKQILHLQWKMEDANNLHWHCHLLRSLNTKHPRQKDRRSYLPPNHSHATLHSLTWEEDPRHQVVRSYRSGRKYLDRREIFRDATVLRGRGVLFVSLDAAFAHAAAAVGGRHRLLAKYSDAPHLPSQSCHSLYSLRR